MQIQLQSDSNFASKLSKVSIKCKFYRLFIIDSQDFVYI